MDPNALHVYTDGSSKGSPRTGGVGVRLVFPDGYIKGDLVQDFEMRGYAGAPIGQMEIQACVVALRHILTLSSIVPAGRIVIHTDSQYVVDGYPSAIYRWPTNKWQTGQGAPVQNAHQWKEFVRLAQKVCKHHRVGLDIVKVKGHSTDEHNRAADTLAKRSALRSGRRLSVEIVRRKKYAGKTTPGSIVAEGQRISLYVVTAMYMPVQKKYRIRAQVITKSSPYFGRVDFVYADVPLSAGHSYLVTLSKDTGHCGVRKMIRELS